MKKCKYLILATAVLTAGLLTACAGTETPGGNDPEPVETDASGIPLDSILYFNDDPGSAELMQYFEDGNVPEEANILYDQMGSNPDITITDPDIIREVYQRLSQVTVDGKSNMSITDCYHHVQFKLAEDKYVYYSFEGSDLWCYKSDNYDISNSSRLFGYLRELTEEYFGEEEGSGS